MNEISSATLFSPFRDKRDQLQSFRRIAIREICNTRVTAVFPSAAKFHQCEMYGADEISKIIPASIVVRMVVSPTNGLRLETACQQNDRPRTILGEPHIHTFPLESTTSLRPLRFRSPNRERIVACGGPRCRRFVVHRRHAAAPIYCALPRLPASSPRIFLRRRYPTVVVSFLRRASFSTSFFQLRRLHDFLCFCFYFLLPLAFSNLNFATPSLFFFIFLYLVFFLFLSSLLPIRAII